MKRAALSDDVLGDPCPAMRLLKHRHVSAIRERGSAILGETPEHCHILEHFEICCRQQTRSFVCARLNLENSRCICQHLQVSAEDSAPSFVMKPHGSNLLMKSVINLSGFILRAETFKTSHFVPRRYVVRVLVGRLGEICLQQLFGTTPRGHP